MTDLRTAAQQAVEALQKIYIAPEHDEYIRVWWPACEEAITSLKTALAESERDCSLLEATQVALRGHMAEIQRLCAALVAASERKPLTEEEIDALPNTDGEGSDWQALVQFARAIERAHGIGDGIKTS